MVQTVNNIGDGQPKESKKLSFMYATLVVLLYSCGKKLPYFVEKLGFLIYVSVFNPSLYNEPLFFNFEVAWFLKLT